ncbi:MAG TPA: hypothetical protein VFT48_04970 [Pyrinomonadaceae bacterium]|nr:hypothetical protein [Pyrinomonadaceae bacterium]
MSAQTASALNITEEPVTPVIVKVGGDDVGDASAPGTPNLVSIEVETDKLAFAETVRGNKWASSVSTKAGRIFNVTIIDGSTTISHAVDQTSELASVTIMFGPARLIVMESGVPEDNDVRLLITSPEVLFNVPQPGDWTMSTATFTNKIKSVALMVGDKQRLNYEFQTEKASVQIDFNLKNPN